MRCNHKTLSSICSINAKTRFAIYTLGNHLGFYVIKNQNWLARLVQILLCKQ